MSHNEIEHLELSKLLSSPDMSEASLRDLLIRYHIPIDQWGKGVAKTVSDLLKEIRKGECILKEIEREIVRELRAVEIHITFTDKTGTIWKLIEDHIVYQDGRVRKRRYPWSISETLKTKESVKVEVRRAINEELPQIKGKYRKTSIDKISKKLQEPPLVIQVLNLIISTVRTPYRIYQSSIPT